MKIAMLFLAALLPLMAQARNNNPQDTLVVNKPTKVTVITSDSAQTIYIQGKEGNPKYAYRNSIQLVDSNYVSTSTIDNDFNFSFGPFGRKQTKPQKYPSSETTMNFFVGFNAAPGMPQAADLHPFSSWEFWWLIADCGIYPWNSHHKFTIGFGLDWRNYRIKGDTRFTKSDDGSVGLGTYPEGASPQFSRLKVFSLTVPVRYHFVSKFFGFSLGPVVNFNTHSSLKTRWKADGMKIKDTSNNAHVKPVTVDLMATLDTPVCNFYFKYSPCDLIKNGYGLQFKTLSFGVYL